jgi:hypothetical protein
MTDSYLCQYRQDRTGTDNVLNDDKQSFLGQAIIKYLSHGQITFYFSQMNSQIILCIFLGKPFQLSLKFASKSGAFVVEKISGTPF